MPDGNAEFEDRHYEAGTYSRDAATIAQLGAMITGSIGTILTVGFGMRAGVEAIINDAGVGSDLTQMVELGAVTTVGVVALKGLSTFFEKRADRLQNQ